MSRPFEVSIPVTAEGENKTADSTSSSFGEVMERDVPAFTYGNPRSLDLDTGEMVAGHPPGDMEFLGGESDLRVRILEITPLSLRSFL